MKNKMSFRKILLRVFAAFFAFYIGIMSLFTFVQYKNSKADCENRRAGFCSSIMKYISSAPEFSAEHRNLDIPLSYFFIMQRDFFCTNENYIRAALYTETGEKVVKTGNYIACPKPIIVNESNFGRDSYESYFALVDVDKYLSSEQITHLFELIQKENDILKFSLSVSGYQNKNEIIPKKITIYKEEWKPTDAIVDKQIIKSASRIKREFFEEYTFIVEDVEGLKKYRADNCTFYPESIVNVGLMNTGDSYSLMKRSRNEKILRRFEICTPTLTKEMMQEAKEQITISSFESEFYKEKGQIIWYFSEGGKNYYLVVNTVSFPLEIAIKNLVPVYVFSLIMIVLLVVILSRGLWKTYEKQILLEKNRRELTDTIGHELKTPLGIIRTYSEGLKEHISEEKRDHYLEVIIDETAKMDELILEMLDLSKLESKAYTLKEETFCLNTLIQEVLKNKERLFENQELEVTFTADQEWEIVADYKRMMQVINNLVINAIIHTPEGGKIQISIEKRRVVIENEGEPIPENQLPLIWDAFYKGDKEKERCERGTGLGLSIVRNVLELHKMPYGATNTDGGVKFWFELMRRK